MVSESPGETVTTAPIIDGEDLTKWNGYRGNGRGPDPTLCFR